MATPMHVDTRAENSFIAVDENLCVGCELCELVCSMFHENEFKPDLSRIHIFRNPFEGTFAPKVCIQCPNPKCLSACKEKAISIDKTTGAKVIIDEKCTGCGKCAAACPINSESTVLKYHPLRKVYVKCDLCKGEPECTKWCPAGALHCLKR